MTESHHTKVIKDDDIRPGFRYFGIIAKGDPEKGIPDQRDPVTIDYIKQCQGVTDIVSALHHIPQGEVWTKEEIAKRKIEIEFNDKVVEPPTLKDSTQKERDQWYLDKYNELVESGNPTGLRWDTVESLPFTEAIKSCDVKDVDQCNERDQHIANFKESLQNLAAFNIHNVVGNFMPVADWTRTGYEEQPNGTKALKYDHAAFAAFDVHILKRHDKEQAYIDDKSYTREELDAGHQYWAEHLKDDAQARVDLAKMIVAGLPGCQGIKTPKAFADPAEEEKWLQDNMLPAYREQVAKYAGWDKKELRENIATFLDEVAPEAKKLGINLASHPDDPAFSPFMGTPRSVGSEEDYKFLLDHGCGVNLCTGSLMANPENRKDITQIIRNLAEHGKEKGMTIDEIFPHVHLRPIKTEGKNFVEGDHEAHGEELGAIVKTLVQLGWHGVFRPDHANTPTYDLERNDGKPLGDRGYHGANRMQGLSYLKGLFDGVKLGMEPERDKEHVPKIRVHASTQAWTDRNSDGRQAARY